MVVSAKLQAESADVTPKVQNMMETGKIQVN